MKRRKFIEFIAMAGAVLAAVRAFAEKIIQGHCGAKCSACERYKSKACGGCGTGNRAECIVYKCNSRKGMTTCAECRAFPCAKHKKISPPASALS